MEGLKYDCGILQAIRLAVRPGLFAFGRGEKGAIGLMETDVTAIQQVA